MKYIFLIIFFYCLNLDAKISRAIPSSDNSEVVKVLESDKRNVSRAGRQNNFILNTDKINNIKSRKLNNRKDIIKVNNSVKKNNKEINDSISVRRAGVVLRPTTADFGGRAIIYENGRQTGSNIKQHIRKIQKRSAVNSENSENIIPVSNNKLLEVPNSLKEIAELDKSCQEQYNECMDQFCAVIDNNQKRCSCSSKFSSYTKAEESVKKANVELNDIAQKIRYVGLSADEVKSIISATEAELVLSGSSDNSESRKMLKEIENIISKPSDIIKESKNNTLDLDINLESDNSMFNIDDMFDNKKSSFAHLRGIDLYNAGKKRCDIILNKCKKAGATEEQIIGNYEISIDKDCIAYEKGLLKMRDSLHKNIKSANQMLQKARLNVLYNKNQYNSTECLKNLSNCMTEEVVCGKNYYKCLDPEKKYIDENGKIVLGENVRNVINNMKDYDNSKINSQFLNESINNTGESNDGKKIIKYLLSKIGSGESYKDGGLCRPVLDKCQQYTYKDGKYFPNNDIVVNYIQKAMLNIKNSQNKIISDYASRCLGDLSICYLNQESQIKTWVANADLNDVMKVMRGACYKTALSCGYALYGEYADCNKAQTYFDGSSQKKDNLKEIYNNCGFTFNVDNCSNCSDIQTNCKKTCEVYSLVDEVSQLFFRKFNVIIAKNNCKECLFNQKSQTQTCAINSCEVNKVSSSDTVKKCDKSILTDKEINDLTTGIQFKEPNDPSYPCQ